MANQWTTSTTEPGNMISPHTPELKQVETPVSLKTYMESKKQREAKGCLRNLKIRESQNSQKVLPGKYRGPIEQLLVTGEWQEKFYIIQLTADECKGSKVRSEEAGAAQVL